MNLADWQQQLQQGIKAVQARQAPLALQLLQSASSLRPASREVAYWLGNAQRLNGQTAEAEQTFRRLLTQYPVDFDLAMALAFLLREQGRMAEVGDLLIDVARQAPGDSEALLKIAGFLRDGNLFDQAIEAMQLLLVRDASQAINHFRLARLHQGMGQHEAALQSFRETLQRDSGMGGAWLGLASLQRFTDPANADWQWLQSVALADENLEGIMCLAFARGKGHDDLGQYEQAWNHFVKGNRLCRLSRPWSQTDWRSFQQQVMSLPCRSQIPAQNSRKPVFIVGMLRSGTSLLEQLLDQHPRVTARGELNFLAHAWAEWRQSTASDSSPTELSTQLWRHIQLDGPAERCYIDKNPLNFRFLPMVAAILPEAKILHLLRDGRDSCLSSFMQLFQHPDTAFSNQLDDLVDFYHGYLLLMQHFRIHMPEQILSLNYQQLVTDTQTCMQAAWNFLGLDMPATSETGKQQQRPIRTASTWQARQHIHRNSLGRWQNYYSMAPAFFDRIADLDRQFGGEL